MAQNKLIDQWDRCNSKDLWLLLCVSWNKKKIKKSGVVQISPTIRNQFFFFTQRAALIEKYLLFFGRGGWGVVVGGGGDPRTSRVIFFDGQSLNQEIKNRKAWPIVFLK